MTRATLSRNVARGIEFWRWMILMTVVAGAASGVAQDATDRTVVAASGSSASLPPSVSSSSVSSSTTAVTESIRQLQEQVRELQAAVAGMRSDWQRSREETVALRRELDQVRAGTGTQNAMLKEAVVPGNMEATPAVSGSGLAKDRNAEVQIDQNQITQNQTAQNPDQKKSDRSAGLDEEYQLLTGKIDDQYQTKVESASKYRLRLSGIVLMNLVSNQGVVDSIDTPTLAYPRPAGDSGGSFGATLRQSQIGIEAFGPTVAGAKTSADLQVDFGGGFPVIPNGVTSGILRLRTATMRMDWTNTSVVVGQDGLFFSPSSPTSFASLAVPALTNAGNLWSWVPQIRVEHRITLGENSTLLLQGGILDPLTGEAPESGVYRQPDAGESSRQPAYGSRIAWTRNIFGQPLRVGVGGYYSRQDYGFSRTVDGWAGMSDIEVPLGHQFSLSGKVYRGRAIGGLYGGIWRSVLFSGDPMLAGTQVKGLDTVGGWAQLKYRPANKWEFNAAFGMDNPYASDLRLFPYAQAYGFPALSKNEGSFVNMIYRPRSDLLFSAEYRHLTTYALSNGANNAGQLNLMMGVLF
jgi:hypothetical protein